MSYLRKVAQQGAETHQLLRDQEAPTIDLERCTAAWEGLKNEGDFPSDTTIGGVTSAWGSQIQQFFVDSCVSGKPKPIPGDPTAPATPPRA